MFEIQKGGSIMSGNREYKSDVFSMLLEEPENALEIYNALNGTDYRDPDMVQIIKLNKGISLSVRNDAEFIIDFDLNIYEHQSTYNPNMPLRGLVYFVDKLDDIIKSRDIYGRRLIKIPTPHFVVFYNGLEKRPEKEILRLSDAFYNSTDDPELELKCTVYNINPGCNEALLKNCPVLRDYMAFVGKVRSRLDTGTDMEASVEQAIEECIHEGVLVDFLKNRRKEVTKNMVLDYTWERREEMIRREEREEGRNEAKNEGIKVLIELCQEYGVPLEEIERKLIVKYHLSQEEAREKLQNYMETSISSHKNIAQ
jgi:hypothetical protein